MTQKNTKKSYVLRAWIIWILSAFFMFYKNALEISPSVMNKALMTSFDISAANLGNLVASYFYAYLLLQIPAGLLLDKFGPRKVSTIAIFFCGLGCVIFSSTENLFWGIIGRFIIGVGAAFAAINCIKLTANWFPPKQFAFMTGLMMTVAMLGAVGGQAPLFALVNHLSWQNAIRMIGFVGFVLAVLFYLIVRDKAPDHKKDMHLTSEKINLFQSIKKVLRSRQSWILSIYSGLSFAPVMVFGGLWGVSFVEEAYGLSKNLSAQLVSMIFIGFALGAPLFGWYSDWLGKRKPVMFWGVFLAMLCISCIIYLPMISKVMLITLLFLFGFFLSGFLLSFTMIREAHSIAITATAVGFMNVFNALCGAISDPLAGVFLDATWDGKMLNDSPIFSTYSYQISFLLIPLYCILALFSLFFIKESRLTSPSPPSTLP